MALLSSTFERISCGIWLMTAADAPGFDGCELLVPTKRRLIFFFVGPEATADIDCGERLEIGFKV